MTDVASVKLLPTTAEDESLWHLTREIGGILVPLPWVLVGGQMVAVLEAEHGVGIGFATSDVDAVLDVRASVGVTEEAANRLMEAGFEPDVGGARGYRFVRGEAIVDLLAPDNLGPRANLRTIPPEHTIEAVGGTQALARARLIELDTGDGPFRVPIPTLAGAIVIKSRVAALAGQGREKHERDLARLLALIPDVRALRTDLTARERGYLRKHQVMVDVEHPAWRRVAGAEDGAAALAFVIDTD